jgi:hypothetical protein
MLKPQDMKLSVCLMFGIRVYNFWYSIVTAY